jgi:hypothetical protein
MTQTFVASLRCDKRVAVAMPAMTIHRALKIPISTMTTLSSIETEGLIAEETSMNSSPLVATVLINTSARHIIFIGDRHQLQPIGHGQPFADMIASKVILTVYLTENFRTSCKGIQALCADILHASVTPEKVPGYDLFRRRRKLTPGQTASESSGIYRKTNTRVRPCRHA